MKITTSRILGTGAIALLAMTLMGCPSQEQDRKKEPAKVVKPSSEVWTEDIDGAFKAAADAKKPVFIDFTGSDWCGWCKIADKNIFTTKEWKEFAAAVVCLKVDFPQTNRPDAATLAKREKLAEAFGVQGFPTLVLATADRKELARFVAGRKSAAEFISDVRKALK